MLARRPVFPGVIEMNTQAGWRIGCNVYLIHDDRSWGLIDIGYEETVDEIIEMIRQMDFPLSQCRALVATHADVDHIQGLAKAKGILKAPVLAHPKAVESLESGDRVKTFAEIAAQNVHMEMPIVKVDRVIADGDTIEIGSRSLEVWHTPGHTDSQLAFRMGDLLISGDNIYRDGSVGAIDAHHGSDIPAFIRSLERIAANVAGPTRFPDLDAAQAHLRVALERTMESGAEQRIDDQLGSLSRSRRREVAHWHIAQPLPHDRGIRPHARHAERHHHDASPRLAQHARDRVSIAAVLPGTTQDDDRSDACHLQRDVRAPARRALHERDPREAEFIHAVPVVRDRLFPREHHARHLAHRRNPFTLCGQDG